MLLTAVSQAEDKNLESLISGVLGEAVRLNEMGQEEPAQEEKIENAETENQEVTKNE